MVTRLLLPGKRAAWFLAPWRRNQVAGPYGNNVRLALFTHEYSNSDARRRKAPKG